MLDVIAFDADDTLWHNETLYSYAQERLQEILAPYRPGDGVVEALYDTEMGNLRYFGYGFKSFTLSMIETAVRLTGGEIGGRDVQKLVDLAKELHEAPVRLLDHVEEVIPALSASFPLMLVTKGDLFDQEAKIARSGLASHFAYVEIVRAKTVDVYRSLLAGHGIDPRRFLMVGNSLRSDVLPVVTLGGQAVYIPYHITWEHERVDVAGAVSAQYVELEHLGLLPAFVQQFSSAPSPMNVQKEGGN